MKGKMLLGAIVVFSVGALVGIILNPDKDPKARKKSLLKKGPNLEDMKHKLEDLKDQYENLMDRMDEKYKAIKNNAPGLKNGSKADARSI